MTISNWKPGNPTQVRMDTVDFVCYHCAKSTRVPAPYVADRQAAYWKERHDRLMASLNDVVKRCHIEHGTDPMHQWMRDALIALRESFDTEGEEWKKGKK